MESLFFLVGLMLLSAIFSGVETAITSLSPFRLAEDSGGKLHFLLNRKEAMVTTALIGNNLTIVASAILLDRTTHPFPAWVGSTALLSQIALFFMFAELLPKAIFSRIDAAVLKALYWPLLILWALFYPLSWAFLKLGRAISRKRAEQSQIREYLYFFDAQMDRDTLELEQILRFTQTRLVEIIKPLSELTILDENLTVADARIISERTGYTRYPLYSERGDKITGYAHVFDLLKSPPGAKLSSIRREAAFLPEFLFTQDLLVFLREESGKMIFTVNEFGAVTGLITPEDLLEEVAGEFVSAEQPEEAPMIEKIGKNKYRVSGHTDIDDFNDFFQTTIRKQYYETVGGYLMSLRGMIPSEGESIDSPFGSFRVRKASLYTVEELIFSPRSPQPRNKRIMK